MLLITLARSLTAQEIVILLTNDYRDFQRAKEGFQSELINQFPQIKFTEYNLAEAQKNTLKCNIKAKNPRIIFAIGNEAAAFAKEQCKEFHVVFAMVYSPEKYAIVSNPHGLPTPVAGVTIDIDYQTKLEAIRRLLGTDRTITILYSEGTFTEVQQVEKACRKLNLSLVSYPVNNELAVENVLKKLKSNSIFWMLPDSLIYNSKTLNSILKKLNDRDVTVIAPTSKFLQLEYPAHIAVSIDPTENGQQAAILVKSVLNGILLSPAVESPNQIHFFIKKGILVTPSEKIIWVE